MDLRYNDFIVNKGQSPAMSHIVKLHCMFLITKTPKPMK